MTDSKTLELKRLIFGIAIGVMLSGAARAAECPYDRYPDGAARKEEIRKAIGTIPCSLEPSIAAKILAYDQLKIAAYDMYPDNPPLLSNRQDRWKYIYNERASHPELYAY